MTFNPERMREACRKILHEIVENSIPDRDQNIQECRDKFFGRKEASRELENDLFSRRLHREMEKLKEKLNYAQHR
jgi:hypothetical protein